MTNPVYTRLAATANRLMGASKYGRSVTFSRYTPTVNSSTGAVTKGAATSTSSANVVVLPISAAATDDPGAFDNKLESEALAGLELRYVKVAAASITFEPKAQDEVTMDGATWRVLGCTPVNPAGTALVYGVGLVKL